MPIRTPGRRADHRSTANVRVPRAASWSPTCAVALPRPIGPRISSISHVSVSVVAGLDDALEAAVVDPGEERDLAAVLLLDEHGDGTRLRHRLDDQHAGHHRAGGEVAGEPPVVGPHLARRDDAWPGLELDHLVDEQERLPVRQDRLDLVPAERCDRDHAAPGAGSGTAGPRRTLGGRVGAQPAVYFAVTGGFRTRSVARRFRPVAGVRLPRADLADTRDAAVGVLDATCRAGAVHAQAQRRSSLTAIRAGLRLTSRQPGRVRSAMNAAADESRGDLVGATPRQRRRRSLLTKPAQACAPPSERHSTTRQIPVKGRCHASPARNTRTLIAAGS